MNYTCDRNFEYAIGLVLFHPEDSLLKRFKLITDLGVPLYIFDNSPGQDEITRDIKKNPSVHYMTAGKNLGIGYSLLTICATAHAHGHKQILYLDQDTSISSRSLTFISSYIDKLPAEVKESYAALNFKSKISSDISIIDVPLVINSGSLFNLAVLKRIGWHSQDYFVDGVDYEFCVRASRSGHKVGIVYNTPDFDHVSEQPDQLITFLGKVMLVRKYSPTRIKDAMSAYLRLIIGGIVQNRLSDTVALFKSMLIYVLGQIIARLIKDK